MNAINVRQCIRSSLLLAAAFVCISMLWSPVSSKAETTLCTLGSGAGQCDQPQGVSADPVTGWAYVADAGNNRIDVFSSSGGFLFAFGWGVATGSPTLEICETDCLKGLAGSGPGQFDRPRSVAVDHTADRVYVTDVGSYRIQEFDLEGAFIREFGEQGSGKCQFENTGRPIAVGSSGSVYAGEGSAVQKYSEVGACLEEIPLATANVTALAVDPSGNIYAPAELEPNEKGVGKFGPTGTPLCFSPPLNAEAGAIAVDASGNIFVGERLAAIRLFAYEVVIEYNASCEPLERFAYGELVDDAFAPIQGLAAYSSADGDLFVSEVFAGESGGSRVRYVAIPPPGPVVPEVGVYAPAESVSNTKALVRAELNPNGKVTQYHFEYLTQEEWEAQGETFEGPATRESATEEINVADFDLHGVEELIGCPNPASEPPSACLVPETTYRYRVVATNADGSGEGTKEGEPFTTKAALELISTFATEVGTDVAHLGAEVVPLGIPTTGYFEYISDAGYQESGFANATRVPGVAGELEFGSGDTPVLRAVTLAGLAPGTTYHYRVSVTDSLLGTDRVIGPERVFRTFPLPPESPQPCLSNDVFRVGPSALLADCRAYELVSPLEKGSGDVIAPTEVISGHPATLDQSAIDGSKVAYGSYRAFGDAEAGPYTSQYVAERSSEGWQSHTITPLRGRALTEVGLQADTEVRVLSPDLCEAWLTTVAEPPLTPDAVPKNRNIYRRHDGGTCGEKSYEALTTLPSAHPENVIYRTMELQGLSTTGTSAIYTVNDNLEGTSAPVNPEEKLQLYERTPTGTKFVCILPNGKPYTGACSAGTNFEFIIAGQSRAASLDNAFSPDGKRVFWTAYGGVSKGPGPIYLRINGNKTVAVSKVGEEKSGTTASIFLKGNEDSTEALFLTGEDLYEFDLPSETTTLIAHQVPGILGASEDLSRIYVVSKEALTGENADHHAPVAGKPNLYLAEGGNFSFVAALVSKDVAPFPSTSIGGTSATSFAPFTRNSRISPDGAQAVFMSSGSPTGYDNTDARNGKADAEVYRYDVSSEKLNCLSCNPTNARPLGSDIVRGVFEFWAGGSISGWENDLYAARNLAEGGGRVFFESSDALSVHDTNGVGDVYEWEEPGVGTCSKAASSYSPLNGGCIELISSGQSARSSEFNDASPNGDDVFFSTLASLVPQDYGLVDVYDARVDGGLPSPPAPPAECEGEACQNASPAPEAQTPSSLGYEGPGNGVEHRKPKCGKHKVRRSGRCVKRHKHHKKKGAKHGGRGR